MTASTHSVARAVISAPSALVAINAVLARAEALGIRISVAIVDSSALLTGFIRMPGAFLISAEIAQKKARCAASLGFPPEVGEQILASEAPRVREGLMAHPDFIQIHGGLPLYEGTTLIGAIGVSGASEAQDLECALAGVKALGL